MKEKIYQILLSHDEALQAAEIMRLGQFGQRTYVSSVLSELVKSGRVDRAKVGREVFYKVSGKDVALEEDLDLSRTSENEAWQRIRENGVFFENIPEEVKDILSFGFTEMLNNAIDHSRSGIGYVKVWKEDGDLKFVVRDKGIGAFRSVMAKRHLQDELEAIQEIVKGKITTAPRWHSGEGIFWTSKIADRFVLTSYGYRLTVDTLMGDYAIEVMDEAMLGTEVSFEIAIDTAKTLMGLFKQYSTVQNNLIFDTTVIPVRLFEGGEAWISRSEAKKVLQGLNKYKKIILDFKGVRLVGQGFADEIFRVFKIAHPEIEIEAVNMNDSVGLMVKRAQSDVTGR